MCVGAWIRYNRESLPTCIQQCPIAVRPMSLIWPTVCDTKHREPTVETSGKKGSTSFLPVYGGSTVIANQWRRVALWVDLIN